MTSLALLAPPNVSAISGGNLYDRYLVAALQNEGVKAKLVSSEEFGREPVVLVDELCYRYLGREELKAKTKHSYALIHGPASQWLLPDETKKRAQVKSFLSAMRGHVFVSQSARALTEDLLGSLAHPLVLTPGHDHLPRAARKPRSGHLTFLTVARLSPEKGLLNFLGFLHRSAELLAGLPWRWVVVGGGEGEEAQKLRKAVKEFGLQPRVEFRGEVAPSQMGAIYGEGQIYVSTAPYESYGMALAEALVHGLFVVNFSNGGPRELLSEECGLHLQGDEIERFFEFVSRYARDRAFARKCHKASYERASLLPTWRSRALRLIAYLKAQEAW